MGKTFPTTEKILVQEDSKSLSSCLRHEAQRMEERMKRALRKAAVLGLSVSLAMTSLAGCSKKAEFNAEAVALTVNDSTASAGLVKFMSHYLQAYTEAMYDSYYGENSFVMDLDGAGTTLGDMVVDSNISGLKQMLLTEQKMEEYGVSLTEEEKSAITEAAAAFIEANDEEVLTKMCATQENVARYLELLTIQSKMEPEMEKAVDTEVSDEEAAQRTIQYIYIPAETEAETESESETETVTEVTTEAATEAVTEASSAEAESETETAALEENASEKTQSAAETESETAAETEAVTEAETEAETEDPVMAAAKEEAKAKAADIIARVTAGEDLETVYREFKGDDTATVNKMSIGEEDTSISEGLRTASENLADGEVYAEPVEASSGYYVVQMIAAFDREATDARKLEIIEERKSELVTSLYTEWEEAAEITVDEAVLDTIEFDFALTTATEASTEAESEAVTEAGTEVETEAVSETEAQSAAETEAESEVVTEETAETETDAQTE